MRIYRAGQKVKVICSRGNNFVVGQIVEYVKSSLFGDHICYGMCEDTNKPRNQSMSDNQIMPAESFNDEVKHG